MFNNMTHIRNEDNTRTLVLHVIFLFNKSKNARFQQPD